MRDDEDQELRDIRTEETTRGKKQPQKPFLWRVAG
jgi:hypothetical protein